MRRSTTAVAILLLAMTARTVCVPAQQRSGQGAGSWDSVQEFSRGDEIELFLDDRTVVKGKFASASDTKLVLTRDGKVTEFERTEVLEVYRLVSKSKTRSTLIGLGIGAAAGTGVGAIVGASTGPHESGEAHLPALMLGTVGAGAGTITGLLLGRGKKRVLIYRK